MIVAYLEAVDRDSATERGCTGGAMARAAQVGPPGEIRGGFSFSSSPPRLARRAPSMASAPLRRVPFLRKLGTLRKFLSGARSWRRGRLSPKHALRQSRARVPE